MNIERGHVYRGKKKARSFYHNDRQVLYVSPVSVQYDAPTISDGCRGCAHCTNPDAHDKYPTIRREQFEAWAGSDVSEGYPAGDWATQE